MYISRNSGGVSSLYQISLCLFYLCLFYCLEMPCKRLGVIYASALSPTSYVAYMRPFHR